MHAISFQLKRAHLVTTAYATLAVQEVGGMTPARYDVLASMRELSLQLHRPELMGLGDTMQADIVRALGLHPTTVSKMLKRLEEMGWISRRRDKANGDSRRKVVMFTPLGFRKTCQAMRRVDRQRLFLRPFERIARQLRPCEHVIPALQSVWGTIDGIGRFFGDRSFFTYSRGFPLAPPRQYPPDVPLEARKTFIRPCEDVSDPKDDARAMFDVLTNAARTAMDRRGFRSGTWHPPRPRTEPQRARLRRRLERAVANGARPSLLAEWDERERRRMIGEKRAADLEARNAHGLDDVDTWEDDEDEEGSIATPSTLPIEATKPTADPPSPDAAEPSEG